MFTAVPVFIHAGSGKVFAEAEGTLSPIKTDSGLYYWMRYYYQRPQPELVENAIAFINDNDLINSQLKQPFFASFFSIIFSKNPQDIDKLKNTLSALLPHTKETILQALWLSNTQEAKHCLKQEAILLKEPDSAYIRRLLGLEPYDILSMQINKTSDLDMLWGAFFASGDNRYVKKIINTLSWLELNGSQENKATIAQAAEESLINNAHRDSRIMQICQQELNTASLTLKTTIQKVISQAKDKTDTRKNLHIPLNEIE
ncbi:MAG: hypothetical protein PHU64_02550 [Candidatus Omnitrophica bacterium]|nr:hypothetical protein [Candidatus Omnitrophota bacterium]MDD5429403.1 hypothetical protein [Candidatus Omnitrophota bacterium]